MDTETQRPLPGKIEQLEARIAVLESEIARRRQTETALLESENRFASVFHHSPIPVAITDIEDGRLVEVNERFLDLFGLTRAAAIGRTSFELGLWEDRAVREAIVARVQQEGTVSGLEVQFHTASGEQIDLQGSLTRIAFGGRMRLLWMASDITERKQMQAEILEISNREKRRIGQDLHDGLGQLLTGTLFRVAEMERNLREADRPEAKGAADIEAMLQEALAQTRTLAQGLNPVGMRSDGLEQALRALTDSVGRIYGTACTLECPVPVSVGNLETAMHVYRIAQEAVNNALKHGRPSTITVRLSQQDETTTLAVRDDGVGLPASGSQPPGMGLRIMAYRAQMIQGLFDVTRAAEGGTLVTCQFPTRMLSERISATHEA